MASNSSVAKSWMTGKSDEQSRWPVNYASLKVVKAYVIHSGLIPPDWTLFHRCRGGLRYFVPPGLSEIKPFTQPLLAAGPMLGHGSATAHQSLAYQLNLTS